MKFVKVVPCKLQTRTNGKSYWSDRIRDVTIKQLEVNCWNDLTFGELRAHFDQSDWSTLRDGLIYSDQGWMETFREKLKAIGFSDAAVADVHYSEQGMQGIRYVSMDVGETFIEEFRALSTEVFYEA